MEIVQTAFVLIEKESRVLLVQEAGAQCKGLWCLPGGHVDVNEKLIDAALREVKEETGYDIKILSELGKKSIKGIEYKGPIKENHQLIDINLYRGEIISGDMEEIAPDLMDAAWFEKDHALRLPLRWEWLSELLVD